MQGVAIRDDRVLLEARVLAVVVIPALVAAVTVLLGFPHDTKHLIAWEIKAPMSAFALARRRRSSCAGAGDALERRGSA